MKKYKSQIESNPTIFAQMEIAKAAFEVAEKMEEVLTAMKLSGFVKPDSKLEVMPYNSGYEIKTDIEVNPENWEKVRELEVYKVVDRITNIYLYPASFFNHNIRQEHGATLEGRFLSYETKYVSTIVRSNKDIALTVSGWKRIALDNLDWIAGTVRTWKQG